jgi:hypothetical protein
MGSTDRPSSVDDASRYVTVPKSMSPRRIKQTPADLLEHEFAQEMASALGRLGRALEAALAALVEFDRDDTRDGGPALERRQERSVLVAQASVALWHFVVQREACGLRDMRHVLRDYRVPPEVAARMGVLPIEPTRVRKTDRRP